MKIISWPAYKNRNKNPFNFLLYRSLSNKAEVFEFSWGNIVKRKYDIFHFHWPEAPLNENNRLLGLLKIVFTVFLIVYLKAIKTKIVWTVHNLKSHENRYPWIEKQFWEFFTRNTHALICFTHSVHELAINTYPQLNKKPFEIIPHGHYKDEYPRMNLISKKQQDFVFLYFGAIRQYKNVTSLVKSFKGMKEQRVKLVVVGKPRTKELEEEIVQEIGDNPRIKFNVGFIPKEEVSHYFSEADVVVLPYSDIVNSGTALLALSFDRPILAPRKGSFSELRDHVGKEWLDLYEGDISTQILEYYYLKHCAQMEKPSGASPNLKIYEWESIANETYQLYKSILK